MAKIKRDKGTNDDLQSTTKDWGACFHHSMYYGLPVGSGCATQYIHALPWQCTQQIIDV